MDHNSNKNLIESLLRSVLMQDQHGLSNKNNIVLMNPEIHLHNNDESSSTDESTNNVVLKKMQDELHNERQRRESEERRRQDENMKNQKLLTEKDCQIKNQNEILSRQIEILDEQRAHLEKVYAYDRRAREQRIQLEPYATNDYLRRNQCRKWNGKIRPNRSFTNVTSKHQLGHKHRNHRSRSKTTDSMELWEWNGIKWVMVSVQNNKQFKRDGGNEQKNQNFLVSSQNEGHSADNVNTVQNGASHTNALLADNTNEPLRSRISMTVDEPSKVVSNPAQVEDNQIFYLDDNEPLRNCNSMTDDEPSKVVSNPAQVEDNQGVYLDDSDDNDTNFTDVPELLMVASEPYDLTFPTNISISFDDNEIIRRWPHDESLFSVPRRNQQRQRTE